MPTILLVDDDVALVERLATLLSELGHTVVRANRVQHAELLLAEQRPDMLVLDPDIGNGDGWLLIRQAVPQTSVILISGQGLEEDVIRALDAGVSDVVPKPFRTGELLARIRARLRERVSLAIPDRQPAPRPTLIEPPVTGATLHLDRRTAPVGRDRRGALAPGDQEEPVFISSGEEERLLRQSDSASANDIGDIAQLPLGQRLHAARQRKRITLVQAELETRPSVPMHYIQAMEEEKFSLLPRGPIAEELLRTYATYLGLNASTAVDEYRRLHYNAPVEPIAALGGAMPPRRVPRWLTWLLATLLALAVGGGGIWLYDPRGVTALAERAGLIASPPTATPAPTSPPPTAMPTIAPTAAPSPTATAAPSPTATPSPTVPAAATSTTTTTP
jgi:DNA-binding response OmpR family regulator